MPDTQRPVATAPRGDTMLPTETLTNARTRIVGDRTGALADAVIATVRFARSAAESVRGVLRRVAAVVTPLGWAMLAVIPIALGAGYGLGWTELVVIGFACLVLAAIAGLSLAGRVRLDVDLRLAHDRVVVGDAASGVVRVANPRRARTFGTVVEVPVGAGIVEFAVPSLAPGAEFVHELAVPTARRGVVGVGPVRTVRADPIGLVRRELAWTGVSRLVVHPRTVAIPSMSTGLVRDLEGSPTRDLTSSDVSFHALREYQPGDDRRFIHWKSTARTGVHMVRQFEETRRSHLVVALSRAEADYALADEFELAVSVVGSLGTRAIRDGRAVTVVTGEATPEYAKRRVLAVRNLSTASRARLLDDLAVVEQAESALSLVDVARVTAEQTAGVSVAFLVCGSRPMPRALRAAASAFPLGVEVVAVVCDPDRTPGLRRVAGMNVLSVGYLDDVRHALASAVAA